jgi:[acyl-carrier-protein] S-malonyltransferase
LPVHAFVFPGQGSQSVGMGRDLAAAFAPARLVFEEVDDALGQRLSKIMWEGPAETLTLTENAQPALMAVSLAVLRVLEQEAGVSLAARASLVAGHSLGEWSALTAAGTFGVADCARLLRRRGQAMQEAVPAGLGAMAALIGVEIDAAREVCRLAVEQAPPGETPVVEPANDNGGGQVVISGHREAVERAVEIARGRGVKRTMLLPVSAPFHCALMAPAAEAVARALETVTLAPPAVPVLANVTAEAEREPDRIRHLLVEQVTSTVRWRESVIAALDQGVESFVELGAGKVLTGLVRRIAPDAQAVNAGTPGEVEALVKIL